MFERVRALPLSPFPPTPRSPPTHTHTHTLSQSFFNVINFHVSPPLVLPAPLRQQPRSLPDGLGHLRSASDSRGERGREGGKKESSRETRGEIESLREKARVSRRQMLEQSRGKQQPRRPQPPLTASSKKVLARRGEPLGGPGVGGRGCLLPGGQGNWCWLWGGVRSLALTCPSPGT